MDGLLQYFWITETPSISISVCLSPKITQKWVPGQTFGSGAEFILIEDNWPLGSKLTDGLEMAENIPYCMKSHDHPVYEGKTAIRFQKGKSPRIKLGRSVSLPLKQRRRIEFILKWLPAVLLINNEQGLIEPMTTNQTEQASQILVYITTEY